MSDYTTLESLVHENGRSTELECREYLHLATDLLLPTSPQEIIHLNAEDRNFFGSTDYIICARLYGDTGANERAVSLWEIKAPQAYLMEQDDNKNRYRPTKELYKAENQLIHYWYHARNDGTFRQRFGLTSDSQVKLGGIVIGRFDRITRDEPRRDAAQLSLDIRRSTLYQPHGIKVYVWDRLLRFANPANNQPLQAQASSSA
jgi:hypothetical protein